jgi:4-amino-4-deoxy-L-arabinose transferase-like glycosyltransferase
MNISGKAGAVTGQTWLALAAVVFAAAALRFWDLGGPSLWTDELYTLGFSRLPSDLLWGDWMVRETNPPLFYSLLAAWKSLFGESEVALRALAAVIGVMAIVAVFFVGRGLHSNAAGLMAAALTAVSAQQLQYSQFVRGYTLGFLAAACAIIALLQLARLWRSQPGARLPWLALYAGATTTAFYTHTTFFILPILANAYIVWLWFFRTQRNWRYAIEWIAANAIVLIACLWWVGITLRQVQGGAEQIAWIESPSMRDAAMKTAHVFATRSLGAFNLILAAVFAALIGWGAWRLDVERRVLVAIFGVGVPLVLFVISLKQPVFMERTLYWAQAIYFPCLAVGVLSLPVRQIRAPLAATCVAALAIDAIHWRQTDYREPWRDIARVLTERAAPQDAILAYSADAAVNLEYYCRRLGCGGAKVFALRIRAQGREVLAGSFAGAEVHDATAKQLLSDHQRIWVLQRGLEEDPAAILPGFAEEETANALPVSWPDAGKLPVNYMKLAVWRPGVRLSPD